jgi:hypothetical protein
MIAYGFAFVVYVILATTGYAVSGVLGAAFDVEEKGWRASNALVRHALLPSWDDSVCGKLVVPLKISGQRVQIQSFTSLTVWTLVGKFQGPRDSGIQSLANGMQPIKIEFGYFRPENGCKISAIFLCFGVFNERKNLIF